MTSFKMNKDFERMLWVKQHGKPIFENNACRIYYEGTCLKCFYIKSKKKRSILEDENGFYFQRYDDISIGKAYLIKDLQDQLKEAVAERELLG